MRQEAERVMTMATAERRTGQREYSLFGTACYFLAGGLVTAVFSGSLAMLTPRTGFMEVLTVGMVVPSFTWVVQLAASGLLLTGAMRGCYWGDLARICLAGSVALLPSAIVNLLVSQPPFWPSIAGVLLSVVWMAADLFRRCRAHGIATRWPISWCLTISLNIAIFLWTSRNWW